MPERPPLRIGPPGVEETLRGHLREVPGEGHEPATRVLLHTADGGWVAPYIEGDNPLENTLLRPHLDAAVELTGRWKGSRLRLRPEDLRPLPAEVVDD